jgi:ubiquinone/menaquinone biosynthesis C-methylase UbiE
MSEDALHIWQENAHHWTKHSDTIHTMFVPLTRALIERAGIREGQSVLDVAAGAGEPSLTIAKTVGSTGSVMCTDAVLEMVEAARSNAKRLGLTNIEFRQCSADSLPFAKNSFDAGVSRLGIMFFPDPVAAVREMLRVLKPNGTLAFAVWGKSEINPFCYLITGVIERHVKGAVVDPHAPNAFRFAETGKLAGVLSEAGAIDIDERVFNFNIEAPLSPLQFWTLRSQTSDTLREKLAQLPAAQQTQIASEVEQAVKDFFPNNQMRFPAQMIIATGKKPRQSVATD